MAGSTHVMDDITRHPSLTGILTSYRSVLATSASRHPEMTEDMRSILNNSSLVLGKIQFSKCSLHSETPSKLTDDLSDKGGSACFTGGEDRFMKTKLTGKTNENYAEQDRSKDKNKESCSQDHQKSHDALTLPATRNLIAQVQQYVSETSQKRSYPFKYTPSLGTETQPSSHECFHQQEKKCSLTSSALHCDLKGIEPSDLKLPEAAQHRVHSHQQESSSKEPDYQRSLFKNKPIATPTESETWQPHMAKELDCKSSGCKNSSPLSGDENTSSSVATGEASSISTPKEQSPGSLDKAGSIFPEAVESSSTQGDLGPPGTDPDTSQVNAKKVPETDDRLQNPSTISHSGTSRNDVISRYKVLLAENEKLKKRHLCRCCEKEPANVTLLPCGHLIYCEECANKLTHCGACRREILADVKTFLC